MGSLQIKLVVLCIACAALTGVLMMAVAAAASPSAVDAEALEEGAKAAAEGVPMGWLILPLLGGVAIAALLGTLFSRSGLITPLRKVEEALEAVQQQWDLTHQVHSPPGGEVGDTGRAVNRFLQRLGLVLNDLSESSNQLAAASTRISQGSTETAEGVENQASMLAQVAATVLDMSRDVEEIAQVANNVSQNAETSREIAESGSNVVSEAASGMEAIKVAVMETSTSVNGLGERSRQIGEVIEVIGDIADQTNLLALNAAIEAARAGEHGRGFAVVADEVRKLAERTSRATGEVTEVIKSIQTETGSAVQRMGTVAETVEEGMDRASSASHSLLEIVNATQEVSRMVERIAAAAADQNAKSRSISGDIKEISSMSKKLTTGADESAAAAHGLADRAERLRTVMNQFTVPGGAGGSRQNMMHTLTGIISREDSRDGARNSSIGTRASSKLDLEGRDTRRTSGS